MKRLPKAQRRKIQRLRAGALRGDLVDAYDLALELELVGDDEQAERWHRVAAGGGDPRALCNLGRSSAGESCSMCAAKLTWESLCPATQCSIDAAICRGPILGLLAMRELTQPIRLPHAADLLAFRNNAGVGTEAAESAGHPRG